MTSTQNPDPKTIMYLFIPKVSGNLPALTLTTGDNLFKQALGHWDGFESPNTKRHNSERIW